MDHSYKEPEILFEDEAVIVAKKPSGVPSESAEISRPDMVRILKNHLALSSETTDEPYLALLHRLDQPVEGIMVFGKTKKAAAGLSKDIQAGKFKKEYLAACHPMENTHLSDFTGADEETYSEILLEDYLLNGSGNMVTVAPVGTPNSKKARLYYLPLKENYTIKGGYTGIKLVRVTLITGRHHQIRVQLSNAGLPVVGDRKYGCMPDDYKGMLCLAATGLTFIHPLTQKSMHFEITPKFMDELTMN